MTYKEVFVLIPCHSLEDFPEDLGDSASESLLNAFAVAWHPALLNATGALPRWYRADEPPTLNPGQLFFLPEPSDGWAPCDLAEQVSEHGGTLIKGARSRSEYLESAGLTVPAADDLTHDFFALGTAWLLVELLTRKMRNYGNVDEYRLKERLLLAARAWEANDRTSAELNLKTCFTILQEAREQFYPVDCYLLDLCLLSAEEPAEPFEQLLNSRVPANLLSCASDWRKFTDRVPGLASRIAEHLSAGEIALVGGEHSDYISPLATREVVVDQFEQGRAEYQNLFGRVPLVWGRRTFGLTSGIPQLLKHFGYRGALHLVLDDGIYPDEELSQFLWQGNDDSVIPAFSRIPLAGDAASSWLRMPTRLGESMDHDHLAAIALARWPNMKHPWLDDLRRTQKYAHPLGRFITFDEFFTLAAMPGKQKKLQAGEYFSPMLWQEVARRQPNPLASCRRRLELARAIDAGEWSTNLAHALTTSRVPESELAGSLRRQLLQTRANSEEDAALSGEVKQYTAQASRQLAESLVSRKLLDATSAGQDPTGFLLINTLSFPRRSIVALPSLKSLPNGSAVKLSRVITGDDGSHAGEVIVDLPPAGFCWIPADGRAAPPPAPKLPLAEPWILRNDQFEISLSEQTGGIRQVREHTRRANHLSQLICYRFPREKSYTTDDGETVKTSYALMKATGCRVLESDSITGAIETTGSIVDPSNANLLATYRQVTRVWRSWPGIEIEIELIEPKLVEGNPWQDCFVCRFAGNDCTMVVTRSVWEAAQPIKGERIEGGDYLELASDAERLTIIPHGLPFHRKTSDRIVETLIGVSGEKSPRARMTLLIGDSYPQAASLAATTPVLVVPTFGVPQSTGAWLMHVDLRSVQIKRLLPSRKPEGATSEGTEKTFVVELIETEGSPGMARVSLFCNVVRARKISAAGETLFDLVIESDSILVEFRSFEMCWIEVTAG